jgi:polyhydroxyalkanoate synthesis repressor PhaR
MPIIKRYPNRKLYDTQARRYINLDDLAQMIRQGDEIQVIDHASGKDITTLTYSQVILEQEKKSIGFLPHSLLSDLIQAGGNRLSKIQRKLAASTGFRRLVDDEIQRRMSALIQDEKIDPQQGEELLKELLNVPYSTTSPDETLLRESELETLEMERILEKLQVPSRKDIQELMDQVDTLIAQLDALDLDQ